jgi:hypothetical protein
MPSSYQVVLWKQESFLVPGDLPQKGASFCEKGGMQKRLECIGDFVGTGSQLARSQGL